MCFFSCDRCHKTSVGVALLLGWAFLGPVPVSSGRQLFVVHQTAMLRDSAGNQLQAKPEPGDYKLPAGTVVVCDDVVSPLEINVASGLRHILTTESKPREGWVSHGVVMPLSEYAVKLVASKVAPEAGKARRAFYRPWLIRFQENPAVSDAWENVNQLIAANEKLPAEEQLPDPYFARAAIWVAVQNYADAIQDYITGIQLSRRRGEAAEVYLPYVEKLAAAVRDLETNPVPVIGAKLGWADAAQQHFTLGYTSFFTGDYDDCLVHFTNSLTLDPLQPHYWYFRALTQRALGQSQQAQHDALLGVHFEQQIKSDAISMNQRLFRVQGQRRTWLEKFRNGLMAFHLLGPNKVNLENEVSSTSKQGNAE